MTTAANIQYDYEVVRSMVLNLPKEDRDRLRREMDNVVDEKSNSCKEPEIPFFGPKTKEEAVERLRKAKEDIRIGKTYPIEQLFDELDSKFPWLSE